MAYILISGDTATLTYHRMNIIKAEENLQKKLKTKLTNEKKDLYKNRLKDIKKQKIRNLVLFALTNKNEKLAVELIKHYYPYIYYDYAYEIFEYCCVEQHFGIVYLMMKSEEYMALMKDYIHNNEYSKKYNLNVLENMMCYLISYLIDKDSESGVVFFTNSFNISGIANDIISNFIYCCIKNGSQNIYNHLYKYFKVGEKGIYTDDEMNVANILIGMN